MTYIDAGGIGSDTGEYRSIDINTAGDYIAIAYLVSESISELPNIKATITSGTVKRIVAMGGHNWNGAYYPIGIFAVHTEQNATLTISATNTTAVQHIAIALIKIENNVSN